MYLSIRKLSEGILFWQHYVKVRNTKGKADIERFRKEGKKRGIEKKEDRDREIKKEREREREILGIRKGEKNTMKVQNHPYFTNILLPKLVKIFPYEFKTCYLDVIFPISYNKDINKSSYRQGSDTH